MLGHHLKAVERRDLDGLDHGAVHCIGDGAALLCRAAFAKLDSNEGHDLEMPFFTSGCGS